MYHNRFKVFIIIVIILILSSVLSALEKGEIYKSDINSWNPSVEKKINEFVKKVKEEEIKGQKAVFDADGTLWQNDLGETFLKWLIENKKLENADYSKDIYKEYEDLVKKDPGKGFIFAVTLMKGIDEKDLKNWAEDFFNNHFKENVYPKQKELIKRLKDAGVEVWIVSASNFWSIEGAAPYMGVEPAHVIAIKTEVENGKLTDKIITPVLHGPGKVEAIKKYIGDRVDLVSGNSMSDYDMLKFSTSLSLVINPSGKGPGSLMELAENYGWSIQKWEK
jgi:HAD superfamily phosphoserine phosphatase-like hydrolase